MKKSIQILNNGSHRRSILSKKLKMNSDENQTERPQTVYTDIMAFTSYLIVHHS